MLLETGKPVGFTCLSATKSPLAWHFKTSATLRGPCSQEMFWFLWDPLSYDDFAHFCLLCP